MLAHRSDDVRAAPLLAIAANFTAEPLQDSLDFWLKQLGLAQRVEFAPFDQIFQQLLSPDSLLAQNGAGVNVILLRFDPWLELAATNGSHPRDANLDTLIASLLGSGRKGGTTLVGLCPLAARNAADPDRRAWASAAAARLHEAAAQAPELEVLTADEVLALYPVEQVHDEQAEQLGVIPYTAELFAALGTSIARRVHRLKRPPYKVLALDCDNTLWKGIVGEDGPRGLVITAEHRALQEFAVRQVEAGMLLCLCSKNNEADVWEAFDAHPDMPLRREHVLAHRLNWEPKSHNLASLAAELKLGLDSFVFVDDNPLECAEVSAGCRDVLALRLPDSDVERFLRHVWAFDRGRVSKEDRERTSLYRQNLEREKQLAEATTLDEFLAGLNLRVSFEPLTAERVARVADLTQRTNQFNATTVRRTPAEVAALVEGGPLRCITLDVSDRFGDYGLVGVAIFGFGSQALEVDTLLLSCRALGRGVEYRLLEELVRLASERGLARVDVPFARTRKNTPVAEFLERVGLAHRDGDAERAVFRLPAVAGALSSAFDLPSREPSNEQVAAARPREESSDHARRAELLAHVASHLQSPTHVLRAIAALKAQQRGGSDYVAPRSSLERRVANIWCDVLHLDRVGATDGFFDLGGTSLLAAQVVARARREFAREVPLVALFEHATLERFALAIEQSPEAAPNALPPLQRGPAQGPLPLSFNQERVWLIDRLHPGVPVYDIFHAWRVPGSVDVAALEHAIRVVMQRHETLRTAIRTADGVASQHVEPVPANVLHVVDVAGLDDQALSARLRDEAAVQFDLASGSLLRAVLLRRSPSEAVFALNLHHAAGDGWSVGLFLRELAQTYAAQREGKQAALPSLPVQYRDYAAWQRRCVGTPELRRQLDHWKQQLADPPLVLELPSDRPRAVVESLRGGCQFFIVPPALAERVRARAAEHEVTPYVFLLTAFQALLSRYAQQDDILVGIPVAGRRHIETESLIGFFADTVVVRTRTGGDPAFAALLRAVRGTMLDALSHADVPLEMLVEELKPIRQANVNPLFQVMFVLQPPGEALKLGDAIGVPWRVHNGTSKFDLTVSLEELDRGFAGSWEYNSDLFDATTAERMVGHFLTLLEAASAAPVSKLSALPLLTASERAVILGPWAGRTVERPRVDDLAALLEAQRQKTPASVAVVGSGEELTYEELHRRADELANRLAHAGIGPERIVGLALERTPRLLVAVLAVFKLGAAYVPLDPAYPRDRLDYMLRDSGAQVLLTQRSLVAELPAHDAVVLVDDETPAPARSAARAATPGDLAYVIYTSGSTGKPKGVAIEQRSTIEFIHWALDTFTPEELRGVLFATSVCFDLSIFEMLVPLCAGGSVIVADNSLHLPTLEARERVTLVNTVPSAMAELVRAGQLTTSVRVVNLAGEPLPVELARAIQALPHVQKLYNLYGPTEDTTYSTELLVPRDVARMDIGRPLPNTRAYILDRSGQPVPCGLLGELHLAGAGLARGYLGRPELTAEKFVPDPFASAADARMYRTGDRCRWLPDGRIDYLGRLDHQVKVRGFRIELGEIESALRRYPGVEDVVVTAWNMPTGATALAAYLTATPAPGAAELRSFLQQSLPDYMVPAAFMVLDELPLTPNGKVDRKRLPAVELGAASASEFVAPRNAVEEKLAHIWMEHLSLSKLGVRDDFFEIGGHSLVAVRIFAAIERAFGQRLSLSVLFRQPTIEQLARLLLADDRPTEVPLLVELRGSGKKPPLFCVPGAKDFAFSLRELVRHLDADVPVHGLSFERWMSEPERSRSLVEQAAIFVEQLRRIQPHGPYRLLGYCYGGWFAFEAARQLLAAGEQVSTLVLIDSFGPPFSPIAQVTKQERNKQRYWQFADLGLVGKARFISRRVTPKVVAKLDRLRARASGGGAGGGGGMIMADDTPTLPLAGVYAARPIAAAMHVIRSRVQPDWYVHFGDDLPELGWARFGGKGVGSSIIACKRDEALLEPHVASVASIVQRLLG
jgi:amino acid adenylation domain-containing protein/FkbH-like protein